MRSVKNNCKSKYIDYEWLLIKFDNGIVTDYDFFAFLKNAKAIFLSNLKKSSRFLNELIFCEFRHKPVGAPPCGRPSIRANVINLYGYSYISMNILRAATRGRPYKYMFCS